MATKKISELTEITSTVGTEELVVNDGGTSKKIQMQNLPGGDLVEDASPHLGGDLTLNSNDIIGTGDIDITGTVTADGLTVAGSGTITNTSGDTLVLSKTTGASLNWHDGTQTRAGIHGINGSDGMIFRTGSSQTERLRIDSSGNVSIPSGDLDVTGTITADGGLIANTSTAGGTGINLFTPAGDQMRVSVQDTGTAGNADGTIKVYDGDLILNANNVGIGTTSPAGTLHTVANSGTTALMVVGASGNNIAHFYDSSSGSAMVIDSSGNVGIGTSSPTSKLHLFGSGTANGLTLDRGNGSLNLSINDYLSTFTHTEDSGDAAAGRGGFSFVSNAANTGSLELFSVSNATSEVMRITSSGNVGIGTTSPSALLSLGTGHIRLTDNYHLEWGNAKARITGSSVDDVLKFKTTNTERLRIDSGGDTIFYNSSGTEKMRWDASAERLGIGTSSPASTLDVNGQYIKLADGTYQGYLGRGNSLISGQEPSDFVIASGGSAALVLSTGSADRLHIDSSGNVGIGRNDVQSEVGNVPALVAYQDAGSLASMGFRGVDLRFATGSYERLRITSSGNVQILNGGKLQVIRATGGSAAAELYMDTGENLIINNTYYNHKIVMKRTGEVGIGLTSPSYKLDVDAGAPSSADKIISRHMAEPSRQLGLVWDDSTSTLGLATLTNHSLVFYTNGINPRMTIDNSGNVGIGVTPESWQSVQTALQIGGTGSLWASSAAVTGAELLLSHNSYINSGGSSIYIVGDEASRHLQSNGQHVFQVAPLGSAGAAISWTSAMTIQNNGDISFKGSSTNPAGNNVSGIGISSNGILSIQNGSSTGFVLGVSATSTYAMTFRYQGNLAGRIGIAANNITLADVSDYRLKENIAPMSGSITRIKKLKPSTYNFISDPHKQHEGFVAHELSDAAPYAVSGTKDAMMDEEYEVSVALGEVFTPAIEEVTIERQVMEDVDCPYVDINGVDCNDVTQVGVFTEEVVIEIQRQDIDGVLTEVEVEVTKQIPTMESVVTTKAVAEVILESNVEKPKEGNWRETTAQVMDTRSVKDLQGVDLRKLVPLLVAALQEAIARIEVLEA